MTEDTKKDAAVDEETEFDVPDSISFDYSGKHYELGFDRASAKRAEKQYNISLGELTSGKVSVVQDLFMASFLKNHEKTKPSTMLRIFNAMSDKDALYQALVGMYAECANSVLEEPEEGNAISWKAV